jgi:hypothetical protein
LSASLETAGAREETGSPSLSREQRPGVEREVEAGGGLDGGPAAADEEAALAIAGAEEAEDEGEELLGEVGDVVLPTSGLGDGGEELRRRRGEGDGGGGGGLRQRGRGGALAHGAAAVDLPRKGEGNEGDVVGWMQLAAQIYNNTICYKEVIAIKNI